MVYSSLASQQRPGADRAAHPQPVPRALEFWIVWPDHVSVPFDSVENPGEARHIGVARQTTAQARHLIEIARSIAEVPARQLDPASHPVPVGRALDLARPDAMGLQQLAGRVEVAE